MFWFSRTMATVVLVHTLGSIANLVTGLWAENYCGEDNIGLISPNDELNGNQIMISDHFRWFHRMLRFSTGLICHGYSCTRFSEHLWIIWYRKRKRKTQNVWSPLFCCWHHLPNLIFAKEAISAKKEISHPELSLRPLSWSF